MLRMGILGVSKFIVCFVWHVKKGPAGLFSCVLFFPKGGYLGFESLKKLLSLVYPVFNPEEHTLFCGCLFAHMCFRADDTCCKDTNIQ